MGGGAPLAFLNKKTWHPGRFQNQEEVWKREQAAAAEQRKLEELRKQYEDERKDAEYTTIAESAGFKKESRLDWMYAGSLAAKHEAQARQDAAAAGGAAATGCDGAMAAAAAAAGVPTALEKQQQAAAAEAPLMGRAPAPEEHLSRAERASLLPSFLSSAAPASQNEQWARMTNDPLLAIRQQEQEALKRVRQNPVKMQQILKEVEKVRSHKQKKEKKEKKEHKKEHRKEHKKERRSSGHKRSVSRSRSRSRSPARLAPAHRGSGGGGSGGGGGIAPSRGGLERGDIGRRRSRSRSRSRSREGRDGRRRDVPHQPHQPHQHHPQQQHGGSSGGGHAHGGHSSHGHHHERKAGYGLNTTRAQGAAAVANQLAEQAAARAAATRQRLAEASAAKDAAAAAAAAGRGPPREAYRPGALSAEEKAARLAAMMGDAQQHEAARLDRLSKAQAEEVAEKAGSAAALLARAKRAEGDAFASAAASEVFGSMAGGGMGVGARISSRRHYNQR